MVAIFAERILAHWASGSRLAAPPPQTGIGVVLIGHAVIDAGITVSRASEIGDAAEQAKTSLCGCPPS